MSLTSLKPTARNRVYDLVREAGVDVGAWAHSKRGQAGAASNPKYCYEWAFVEPGSVVVLNLWFDGMVTRGESISQELQLREFADERAKLPGQGVTARRARTVDQAVQLAFQEQLPVRVIVCDGDRRRRSDTARGRSRVHRRLLDPVSWAVTEYDSATGRGTVTRGVTPSLYVDQIDLDEFLPSDARWRRVSAEVYARDPGVRRSVLRRAAGRCEWCDAPGFRTSDGRVYLETHHVVPLSETGSDDRSNVIALCPNHHREAHYGAATDKMRADLLAVVDSRLRAGSKPWGT